MKCVEINEQLMDVALGLGSDPQVEAHVRACPACAERLGGLRRTMALMDEWQAPQPSPYFDSRLGALLREEATRPRSWFEWLRKPALAAAMAVLLIAGALLYRPGAHAPQVQASAAQPAGTTVGDLQELDKNHDLFADFEVLDDLSPDEGNPAQNATP